MTRPLPLSQRDHPASVNRHAARLAALGTALLIAIPIAMWLASRSAQLMLSLSALAFLAAAVAGGDMRALVARASAILKDPIGWLMLGFCGWSLTTLLWSHRPLAGLYMWGEMVLPLISALAIAATQRLKVTPTVLSLAAGALIFAALMMAIELKSGMTQRMAIGTLRSSSYIFNRPVITCFVLAVPTVYLIWRSARTSSARALALMTAIAAIAISFYSQSGASKMGYGLLIGAWVATLLAPQLMLKLTAAGFIATLLLAPVTGELATRLMPEAAVQATANAHSGDRIEIWRSFGEALRARPVTGTGFGSTAALGANPVAAEVSQPIRIWLDVGHPHSAAIQLWTETGFIGVCFALAAGLIFLWRLRELTASDIAPRLALFAAAFGIACVGHGAWQGWWVAALAAAVLWFRAGREVDDA